MTKTASQIRLEKLINGQISQKEFDRQERWDTIKFLGILFGGMFLFVFFINGTGPGRALNALVGYIFYYGLMGGAFLLAGFFVVGSIISIVLKVKQWLCPKEEN